MGVCCYAGYSFLAEAEGYTGRGAVNLIVLHGAAGIWDEVACLIIPATAIMGVALAVLREKPQADDADDEDVAGDDDTTAPEAALDNASVVPSRRGEVER